MKRIVCMALALALLWSAPASAATKTLHGTFNGDPVSSVALRVKHAHGQWFVRGFAAEQILISCGQLNQARLSAASIDGLAPVNQNGRFMIRGTSGEQKVKVAGRMLSPRSARGTFHYRGPTEVDGETVACDSGGLHWAASR